MIKIYHNPRCRKSRETMELITERGKEIEVIEYLKHPPSEEELSRIIGLLGIKPEELVRKGEALFKENYKGKDLNDQQWVKVMVENPKLMERPIVLSDNKARIGRPPEKVLEII